MCSRPSERRFEYCPILLLCRGAVGRRIRRVRDWFVLRRYDTDDKFGHRRPDVGDKKWTALKRECGSHALGTSEVALLPPFSGGLQQPSMVSRISLKGVH